MLVLGSDRASPERFLSVTIAVASQQVVDCALQTVFARIARSGIWRSIGSLRLSDIYEIEPRHGGAHRIKVVIYSPRSRPDICVFVCNLQDGWNSVCDLIAKEHRQFQVQVISTKLGDEYPKNKFEVWKEGQSCRVVMVMRDSEKWVSFEKGQAEEFEDVQMYSERLKRKRLTRESIIHYLQRIGWNITSPSFWETDTDAIYFQELRKS